MAKHPLDQTTKLNELCRELDIYEKKSIVKSYMKDLDGNWSNLSCKEYRHCFLYQKMDYMNKKAIDVFHFYNGTTIEKEYDVTVDEELNHLKFHNNYESFEHELLYISPSIRIERKPSGELVVYEPTPIY